VKNMFAARADQLRERAHRLAAVRQERDVLVRLQSLARQDVNEAALRFAVVPMHEAEVARGAVLRQGAADDDLEVALSLDPVTNIAAIEADHDTTLRDRQRLPVRRTPVDKGGSLLRELGLDALGDSPDLPAQRPRVHASADRQDVA